MLFIKKLTFVSNLLMHWSIGPPANVLIKNIHFKCTSETCFPGYEVKRFVEIEERKVGVTKLPNNSILYNIPQHITANA